MSWGLQVQWGTNKGQVGQERWELRGPRQRGEERLHLPGRGLALTCWQQKGLKQQRGMASILGVGRLLTVMVPGEVAGMGAPVR